MALGTFRPALHPAEAADEKLVPLVRRSASYAQAQLHEPGGDQSFSARFNRRPLDTSGDDYIEWAAIGEAR